MDLGFFSYVICELCGGHGYGFSSVGVLGCWFPKVGRRAWIWFFFFFLNVICELCGGHGYEFFGVGVLGYWFVGVGRGFGVFFLCDL